MHTYYLKEHISQRVAANTAPAPDINAEQVIFRNCAPFTDWISEINNTQEYNTKILM